MVKKYYSEFLGISVLVLLIIRTFFLINSFRKEKLHKNSKLSETVIPNILWYIPEEGLEVPGGRVKTPFFCPTTERKIVACNFYHHEENLTAIGAYIMHGNMFGRFPQYRNSNILWGLIYNEAPRANILFMNDKFLELFNFSATYSRYSDVPFPLWYLQAYKDQKEKEPFIKQITSKKYFVNTTVKNYYLKEIAPIMYLQSNPHSFIDRDKYVLKLMEYISIDSYGDRINNKELPKEFQGGAKNERVFITQRCKFLHYTARYKFQIAIESGVCADYISEKLWRPIEQGVVPIYFGSPTVRDFLPNPKSAILIEDFATPELLARYLHELLRNDTKYEEYLEHKTKGVISNKKLINELKTRPNQLYYENNLKKLKCILCRRLHEVNSSKINMVSRKARDCEMPWSLLTRAPDLNNEYMEKISTAMTIGDNVYQNYMKGIPLDRTLSAGFCLFRKNLPLTMCV